MVVAANVNEKRWYSFAFGRFYLLSAFISCEWSLELLHLRRCVCVNCIVYVYFIFSCLYEIHRSTLHIFFDSSSVFFFAHTLFAIHLNDLSFSFFALCVLSMFSKSICRIVEQKPASGLPLVLLFIIIICVIAIALSSSFSQVFYTSLHLRLLR